MNESPPRKRQRLPSTDQQIPNVDTLENLPGSIGEKFANQLGGLSQLVQQGQPNVYMLNAKDDSTDADLRWFHIGPHSNVPNHKYIIFMGATGCGKSTLINGMVNHILGVQWKDPFRFKCVREDESGARNQAHSQTSSVTAYTIHYQKGMAVPYSITIIDTPGYGDTRGVQRDKEITNTIHRFLTQKEIRIEQIHAACFVAASGDSRLTTTQRYILDSVLSIFGKDVKDNIRLLVTFADNADPPVVAACATANFPVTSKLAGIVYSKFNSSVLFTSNDQQVEEGGFCFDQLFWDMGQENFTKFFKMLEGMDGRDLTSTREVIQDRQLVEQSLKSIESELEICFVNIERIAKLRKELQTDAAQMKCVRQHKILFTRGQQALNCRRCKSTCGFKTKCCSCPLSDHGFDNFQWRQETIKVESTQQDALTNQQLLDQYSDELNLTKAKIMSLLYRVDFSVKSVESAALRSGGVLGPADYLTLMRSRIAEEQKPGYLTRLETLSELQRILGSDPPVQANGCGSQSPGELSDENFQGESSGMSGNGCSSRDGQLSSDDAKKLIGSQRETRRNDGVFSLRRFFPRLPFKQN